MKWLCYHGACRQLINDHRLLRLSNVALLALHTASLESGSASHSRQLLRTQMHESPLSNGLERPHEPGRWLQPISNTCISQGKHLDEPWHP